MSYNVSSTITLSTSLTITPGNAALLRREGVLAEGHFLDDRAVTIPKLRCGNDHVSPGPFCVRCGSKVEGIDVDVPISEFWWYGMGSGYMGNLAIAASYTRGEADVVLVWEGGDSVSALKIKDGVVTDHEVSYAIGKANYTLVPETDGDGRGSP